MSQNQDDAQIPYVSIVVPVYNVERYLCQCVDSLLCQTLKNIEIILVDDGSKDNCPAMCDAYAEQDKRVSVIHQENGGYGKACNAGFIAARGEYLGIVEPDDYAELNMFERLYDLARARDLDIARCHYYFYNSRANTQKRVDLSYVPQNVILTPEEHYPVFYQASAVWAMLYRAFFIRENGIKFLETPGASYQDTSFCFKVYACANRFMLMEDALIHYRIDNDNSSVKSKAKVYCVCDEYAEIERFVREKGVYDKLKYLIPRNKFFTYMWNYNRLDKKNGWRFLKVFSREMRSHIMQKTIKESLFAKKNMVKIFGIAFLYPLFHILYQIYYSWRRFKGNK
jgi:glycosyltransferase involved in cell wall biosynthesis